MPYLKSRELLYPSFQTLRTRVHAGYVWSARPKQHLVHWRRNGLWIMSSYHWIQPIIIGQFARIKLLFKTLPYFERNTQLLGWIVEVKAFMKNVLKNSLAGTVPTFWQNYIVWKLVKFWGWKVFLDNKIVSLLIMFSTTWKYFSISFSPRLLGR